MNWDELRVFHAVARAGSLAAAARALKVSQPTVSRRIRDLEADLGLRLFDRLTHGLRLTDAGRDVLEKAREMEAAARAIADRVASAPDRIAGTIRLTAPDGIGDRLLVPRLAALRARHPGLNVELLLTNEAVDLAGGEADVALRLGAPRDETLVGRRVADGTFHLYASREYLARTGLPEPERRFERHLIIDGAGRMAHVEQRRRLRSIAEGAEVSSTFDHLLAQLHAAEAGLGIVGLPPCIVGPDSQLVRLPSDLFEVRLPVWVLTRPDLRRCPRVAAIKAFLDDAVASIALRPALWVAA